MFKTDTPADHTTNLSLIDDMAFYKKLLLQYGNELKQVFIGSDLAINKRSLEQDIDRSRDNRYYDFIRNFKYFLKGKTYDKDPSEE